MCEIVALRWAAARVGMYAAMTKRSVEVAAARCIPWGGEGLVTGVSSSDG
jgi:hypothetical protein